MNSTNRQITEFPVIELSNTEFSIVEPAVAEAVLAERVLAEPSVVEPSVVEPSVVEPSVVDSEGDPAEPASGSLSWVHRVDRTAIVGAVLATVGVALVVRTVLQRGVFSDFPLHVEMASVGLASGAFPGDVLFYWLDVLFAGFQPDKRALFRGLIVIVAVAGGVKMYLTLRFVDTEHRRDTGDRLPLYGALLTAGCMVAFGLPLGLRYPSFVPPNVWHNSTTALLMPFAIGLFWVSLRFLRQPSTRLVWLMAALIALNVAAKPSFMFCWLAVFPVAVLLCDRRRRTLVGAASVTALGVLLLGVQYLYIYVWAIGDPYAQSSGVRIAPFHMWSFITDDIPLALVASYAFPAAALILGGAAVRRSLSVRFALALAAVGLLWFVLVTETGPREYHSNFMWQAIVTNYLLFVAVLSAALPWLRQVNGARRDAVLIIFLLHVLAGLYYLNTYLGGH